MVQMSVIAKAHVSTVIELSGNSSVHYLIFIIEQTVYKCLVIRTCYDYKYCLVGCGMSVIAKSQACTVTKAERVWFLCFIVELIVHKRYLPRGRTISISVMSCGMQEVVHSKISSLQAYISTTGNSLILAFIYYLKITAPFAIIAGRVLAHNTKLTSSITETCSLHHCFKNFVYIRSILRAAE